MRRPAAIITGARSVFAILAIGAWLNLANHCALGAVLTPTETAPETSECPMHSAPAKKKPAAKIPCCKEVRAIVVKCVQASPVAARSISLGDYAPEILGEPAKISIEIQALDTGPPGCFSFAESVLQKSMFSHAPPVS
ncbi:MAG TPA: hypothetical protein VH188_09350 [Chthoniobacterales bacterium]|jgi:hypothetical protein|nr:hypothetical protein [Chthoniobacterales bacterium]